MNTAERIAIEDQQQSEIRSGLYRVMWNKDGRTVYVKDATFFESQGGLTAAWGKRWVEVYAESINDAREKGHELRKEAQAEAHFFQGIN